MSVPTVESAIQALVALGFVRVVRGVGIYVASPRDHTALLNYVWRAASTAELAVMRAAIDERAALIAAKAVAAQPRIRQPRTLSDIHLFANERSRERLGSPHSFVSADFRFHGMVLASLRGMELGAALYERICERLSPPLLTVADVQASDDDLDRAHLDLASAILGGNARTAARLGRSTASRELHSLESTLG